MTNLARHCVGLTLFLWLVPLNASAEDSFRYRRQVVAAPGWSRLSLPNDVLDKSRPQLNDIRLFSGQSEIPYALEESLAPSNIKMEFTNVESIPAHETTALLDRGPRPNPCSAIEIFVAESPPFLKPVTVESSGDRVTFLRIAQSSIFAAEAGHNGVIAFAPNDNRYLRIRLDDRLGAPVHPTTALLHKRPVETVLDDLAVKSTTVTGSDSTVDTYALALPASNLLLASVGITTEAAIFSRNVRVYQSVVFRGELSRRLIREGVIRRAPSGEDTLQISIEEVVGERLEFEIERATVPLSVTGFTARSRPRSLLFIAPASGNLELAYGTNVVRGNGYDVGAALASSSPPSLSNASLGAVRVNADATNAPTWPRRGQTVNIHEWHRRQGISLPTNGTFAYLDLPPAASEHLSTVRVVDPNGAQVPYVIEAEARRSTSKANYEIISSSGKTKLTLSRLSSSVPIDEVGLVAESPEFFERDIDISEAVTDARGELGQRQLAHGHWTRNQGETKSTFWLSIDQPTKTEIVVTVDNGDNAPLEISDAIIRSSHRRIDFAFTPGERLALIWENPNVLAPRYDVALMANTLVTSPAAPATLGPVEDMCLPIMSTPKWFWWAASISGLILTALLARTLLTPAAKDENA